MSQNLAILLRRIYQALFLIALLPTLALAESDKKPGVLLNVETQLLYDDNVYRSARKESSDSIFVIKPVINWSAVHDVHQFDINYIGDYGRYFDENNLDYTGHEFIAHAKLDHSSRLKTDYTLGYHKGFDDPGSTDANFLPDEKPDKWENSQLKAAIKYGGSDSYGQLVGQVKYREIQYKNNEQDYRDYNELQGISIFYYRVAPRTRLLFELNYADSDYQEKDVFGSSQSNHEYKYLTGVTWEATAKTTGVFKIGYRNKNYENKQFSDLTGLALWLEGSWEPTTQTTVTFGASRDTEDSARQSVGGSTKTEINSRVEHSMTQRTWLTGSFRLSNEDFEGMQSRDDDRQNFALGVKYNLLRWLDIGAEYQFEDRDSDHDAFDFTSNVFMLTVRTQFEN